MPGKIKKKNYIDTLVQTQNKEFVHPDKTNFCIFLYKKAIAKKNAKFKE